MRYGLGDLADLYRDRMTLRQLWVRVKALPWEAPLFVEWRAAVEKAAERDKVAGVEDALAMFGRRPEGG